jgi:hypothetical protein
MSLLEDVRKLIKTRRASEPEADLTKLLALEMRLLVDNDRPQTHAHTRKPSGFDIGERRELLLKSEANQ